MRSTIIISLIVIMLTSCTGYRPQENIANEAPTNTIESADEKWYVEQLNQENMIGAWQKSNHVSAAYNEIFVFNKDQTFVFYASGYDDTNREKSFEGSWQFEDDRIILSVKAKRIIEGGTIEEGVLKGTYQFIGGQLVTKEIIPNETHIIPISQFIDQTAEGEILRESDILYPSVYFDEVQYWRLSREDIFEQQDIDGAFK